MKRIIVALACLTSFASAASAYDCPSRTSAASCADGYVWDADKGACVEQVLG
ncbi:hypothetical protein [Celeribacter indicus]|uniref:hypothetical protein n=1 Tax=Celeribacter indicus TaxID=1208324 RepID=UPI000896A9E1|nr:hypothetical protein [Celeribacter indicus]SDW54286.1 hypothetical protein SAMN05443573_104189 [Celeribacter indicus]